MEDLLEYREGKLYWKVKPCNSIAKGSIAGCLDKTAGYWVVRVNGKLYREHRLIWYLHHGYFPEGYLDHINRDRSDNRIENLREVSPTCNARNCGNTRGSTSKIKGVYWSSIEQKWHANITINYKCKSLGYHKSQLEAAYHRHAAEQCLDWIDCDVKSTAKVYIEENK